MEEEDWSFRMIKKEIVICYSLLVPPGRHSGEIMDSYVRDLPRHIRDVK